MVSGNKVDRWLGCDSVVNPLACTKLRFQLQHHVYHAWHYAPVIEALVKLRQEDEVFILSLHGMKY